LFFIPNIFLAEGPFFFPKSGTLGSVESLDACVLAFSFVASIGSLLGSIDNTVSILESVASSPVNFLNLSFNLSILLVIPVSPF